jgi:hypothetical protein
VLADHADDIVMFDVLPLEEGVRGLGLNGGRDRDLRMGRTLDEKRESDSRRCDDVDDEAALAGFGDALDLAARVPTLTGAVLALIGAGLVWGWQRLRRRVAA